MRSAVRQEAWRGSVDDRDFRQGQPDRVYTSDCRQGYKDRRHPVQRLFRPPDGRELRLAARGDLVDRQQDLVAVIIAVDAGTRGGWRPTCRPACAKPAASASFPQQEIKYGGARIMSALSRRNFLALT